jgi:hypothetical protein
MENNYTYPWHKIITLLCLIGIGYTLNSGKNILRDHALEKSIKDQSTSYWSDEQQQLFYALEINKLDTVMYKEATADSTGNRIYSKLGDFMQVTESFSKNPLDTVFLPSDLVDNLSGAATDNIPQYKRAYQNNN